MKLTIFNIATPLAHRFHVKKFRSETEQVYRSDQLIRRDLRVVELDSRLCFLEAHFDLLHPWQPFPGCRHGGLTGAPDHALDLDRGPPGRRPRRRRGSDQAASK